VSPPLRKRQRLLITAAGRVCDLHKCEDWSEAWFDVTIPYSIMARALAKKS